MNKHFSRKFWHYGYENEDELHVFVHGCIYSRHNIYGVFFGYADKRNEWGEIEGLTSLERAQLGGIVRALDIVKKDHRVLHIHTTNALIVERLEKWVPFWKETGFDKRLPEHRPNTDLIDNLAMLFKVRRKDVFFQCVFNADRVPGCSLAISLAIDGYRNEGNGGSPTTYRRSSVIDNDNYIEKNKTQELGVI